MEQHPVPQQISAYHFRLVGDMTIKQFLELAGGIIVAWIIFSLPISSLIRWPLVIASVFIGVALAFLPLEERPLDRWFVAFIKAIYSPSRYIWKKSVIMPSFFEEIKKPKKEKDEQERVDRTRLKQYLETLPGEEVKNELDQKESHFILNILNTYMEVQPVTALNVKPGDGIFAQESMPKVKIRKLQTPPTDPAAMMRGEVVMPKKTSGPKQVQVPIAKSIDVEKLAKTTSDPQAQSQQEEETSPFDLESISPTGTLRTKDRKKASTPATIRSDLPIPSPPTQPNVLVGMVVNNRGNIIDNAIITIKDSQGKVARALKTNKIGQFFIATPLENDTYEIEVEHEGQSFDIIKIELTGQPVLPIEIRAKKI